MKVNYLNLTCFPISKCKFFKHGLKVSDPLSNLLISYKMKNRILIFSRERLKNFVLQIGIRRAATLSKPVEFKKTKID